LEEALAWVGSSMELLRALSEGCLTADGYRKYGKERSSNSMRFEIPPEAFLNGEIDWTGRQVIEQTTRHSPKPTQCIWEQVRMPRGELEAVFPCVAKPFNQQANERATSPGAPLKIDWDRVWIIVGLLIAEVGIIDSKKAFVRLVLDRCYQAKLKPLPDESTIRKKLGALWKQVP
jgi:hypothetical protein